MMTSDNESLGAGGWLAAVAAVVAVCGKWLVKR